MFDAELYRDKAEVETWKERDPILQLTNRLTDEGLFAADVRASLDAQVESEISRAVTFAEAGTWEPVERLTDDVYTPAGRAR